MTDYLVIGSGVAGLNFALKAKGKVVIATKGKLEDSNTFQAQGGLAGCFGKDDSIDMHVNDTLRAGDGLSNKEIAKILARESPKRIDELRKLGVNFNMSNDKFKLSREAVHSRARIVYSEDITGEEIGKVLIGAVKKKDIVYFENYFALELIVENNKCLGARFIFNDNVIDIFAKNTIIATGGMGKLYSITTNPDVATGDGVAIAFRAGAVLEDMEFMQFHPTMLHNSKPSFLISETLRGEGGLLKNRQGKVYMKNYHRDGELAPRDVVSKFSVDEMKRTNSKNVYLDVTHLDEGYLKERFPHIFKECMKYNIDMSRKMIPVSSAAHYMCGGIKVDSYGRTSIKNLYAIGECACNELHGADRLASNSMTEGLVFGTRLASQIKKNEVKEYKLDEIEVADVKNGRIERLKKQLQSVMWDNVGIIRSKKRLKIALEKISKIEKKLMQIKKGTNRKVGELENLLLLGRIIAISAIRRKESRGTHFIQDYPERHDNIWQKHLTIDKNHPLFK